MPKRTQEQKVIEVLERLYKLYPHPKTALHHKTALELLVATIMSAQTTDKLVNTLTPALFARYKTAQDYASSSFEELDSFINKVNFHTTKAKNIIKTGQMLVDKYSGEVPDSIEKLVVLPGVARKTANVVLGNVFNKAEGIVVDTHVRRLSKRLGLTLHEDPVKIEQDLMKIIPKKYWIDFPHLLQLVGREYCPARETSTTHCPIADLFVS